MIASFQLLGEATGIFLEGIFLSLEVFLLMFYKRSLLTQMEPVVHNFPSFLVAPAPLSNADQALTKSDGCPSPTPVASVLPRLRVGSCILFDAHSMTYIEQHGLKTRDMWPEPDSSETLVRGHTYMEDGIKVRGGASLGKLLHVDIWRAKPERNNRQDHIALIERERPQSILRYFEREYPRDKVFILNFQVI
jgi:hypothetical protein